MRRRRYLAAVLATVPLAGCSSDSSRTDSPGGSSGPDQEELVQSAINELENALNAFDTELNEIDGIGGRISFQQETIQAYLDEADSYLDEAEAGSGDLGDQIEALGNTIDFMRSFVSSFQLFADGGNALQTGATYIDNGRYSDAKSTFEDAIDNFEQADNELVVAREVFKETDFTVFPDTNEIEKIELEQELESFTSLNNTLTYMSRAFRDVARGFTEFIPAAESFDDEQYSDATGEFQKAKNHFLSADSVIREAEESASDEVIDDVIGLACYTESLRDAAASYESASQEASESDWDDAESHASDAEAALERCDYQVAE